MYTVTLYYNFTSVVELEQFCAEHRRQCVARNLLGRVYIAQEGINGTLAGLPEDVKSYQEYLRSFSGFEKTAFKDDIVATMPFRRLIVRLRPEIVSLKASLKVDPSTEQGKYLEPHEWKAVLDQDKDVVVIDVRNNYESAIGRFENAICPDVENFYEFEDWLDRQSFKKDQKVLMYCTGGIRCEKFSLLMEKKGYADVRQLHGGIIRYAQEIGDDHYKGKCFVFDDRLAVAVQKDQQEPISRCEITGNSCDQYLNCANVDCNRLFICSEEGAIKFEGCCSENCMRSQNRRPFDAERIYVPSLRKYEYDG